MQLPPPPLSQIFQFRHRSRLAVLVQAIALMAVLCWWAARGAPFSLESSPVAGPVASQLLPCVSYSPFRHRAGRIDVTPFNPQASVTPAEIETDLRILKSRTNCIRTYGISQGLDAVPGVARKLGMRVKLGLWLTGDEAQNRRELARGMALASQHLDVVDLLVVGNEVLLRRELSAEALGKILTHARQHSPVPVTYADVWEFWLRHSALASAVDVVTVHILPYWEDDPVAVDDAVGHVFKTAARVQQQFAGKPVWVGETGWPAAGRQRAGAVPGKVAQSRFVNALQARVAVEAIAGSPTGHRLDFNLIEAFDQPWKRSFEGAMGGHWGLFDEFGNARVALAGQMVVEDAGWWRGPLGALLGAGLAALTLLTGRLLRRRARVANPPILPGLPGLPSLPILPIALTGATLGALAPLQWLMMQQWDRSPGEHALSISLTLMGAIASMVFVLPGALPKLPRARCLMVLVLLFAACTAALVLLLDARYRPFAWWWFLAPTSVLLSWRIRTAGASIKTSNEEKLLALVLASCAVLIAVNEGWRNHQALSYCALLLVLAGAGAWPSGALLTKTSSASKAAGAQSSVV
jgi:exo-beta-1,3-glucanase (GH17 family)